MQKEHIKRYVTLYLLLAIVSGVIGTALLLWLESQALPILGGLAMTIALLMGIALSQQSMRVARQLGQRVYLSWSLLACAAMLFWTAAFPALPLLVMSAALTAALLPAGIRQERSIIRDSVRYARKGESVFYTATNAALLLGALGAGIALAFQGSNLVIAGFLSAVIGIFAAMLPGNEADKRTYKLQTPAELLSLGGIKEPKVRAAIIITSLLVTAGLFGALHAAGIIAFALAAVLTRVLTDVGAVFSMRKKDATMRILQITTVIGFVLLSIPQDQVRMLGFFLAGSVGGALLTIATKASNETKGFIAAERKIESVLVWSALGTAGVILISTLLQTIYVPFSLGYALVNLLLLAYVLSGTQEIYV